MAATERVTLIPIPPSGPTNASISSSDTAGLRIMVRTTTASLSDYPEWSMEELRASRRDLVVTDGACS